MHITMFVEMHVPCWSHNALSSQKYLIKAIKMHPFLTPVIFHDCIFVEDSVLLVYDAMTLDNQFAPLWFITGPANFNPRRAT